jgi:bacillopeptidase F (M6 metalloprotease family)
MIIDGKQRRVFEVEVVATMNGKNQVRVVHDSKCSENDQITRQLCIAHACLDASLYESGYTDEAGND